MIEIQEIYVRFEKTTIKKTILKVDFKAFYIKKKGISEERVKGKEDKSIKQKEEYEQV